MAVVTLTEARRSLAERLGGYRLFKSGVQILPPSGVYVGTADGADAKRQIVSTDIVHMDVAGGSTPVSTDSRKYWNAYIPSVPIQRLVAEKGYQANKLSSAETDQTAATPEGDARIGMITLAEPLGAALAPDTWVELHSVMPPISREQGRGLHACINRALRASVVRDAITLTKVAGAARYSMAAYPWLERDDQIIGISDSEVLSNVDSDPLYGSGVLRVDGETNYLLIDTEPSSTSFYLHVWRPRGSWVKVSGTWATSAVGLVNETDAVVMDADWLTQLSYYYACEALKNAWRDDPVSKHWDDEYRRVGPTAEYKLAQERTLDVPLPRKGQTSTINPAAARVSSGWGWP